MFREAWEKCLPPALLWKEKTLRLHWGVCARFGHGKEISLLLSAVVGQEGCWRRGRELLGGGDRKGRHLHPSLKELQQIMQKGWCNLRLHALSLRLSQPYWWLGLDGSLVGVGGGRWGGGGCPVHSRISINSGILVSAYKMPVIPSLCSCDNLRYFQTCQLSPWGKANSSGWEHCSGPRHITLLCVTLSPWLRITRGSLKIKTLFLGSLMPSEISISGAGTKARDDHRALELVIIVHTHILWYWEK